MNARKVMTAKALELGAVFDKMQIKTVSFEDLARCSAKFVSFTKFQWADNGRPAAERYDELKATAKANGLILSL